MSTQAKSLPLNSLPVFNPIYRLTEAAEVLNCNEQSLMIKFRKGEIKAGKKFGQWFTTHEDLINYIRS